MNILSAVRNVAMVTDCNIGLPQLSKNRFVHPQSVNSRYPYSIRTKFGKVLHLLQSVTSTTNLHRGSRFHRGTRFLINQATQISFFEFTLLDVGIGHINIMDQKLVDTMTIFAIVRINLTAKRFILYDLILYLLIVYLPCRFVFQVSHMYFMCPIAH